MKTELWGDPMEYHLGMRLRHHDTQEEGVLAMWDRDRKNFVVCMLSDRECVIDRDYNWDGIIGHADGGGSDEP